MGSRIFEALEPRRMMAGSDAGTITGVVFNDFNRNGSRDAGEPPLPGYRVFIDRNNDGVCNRNELWQRASSTGRYTFAGLGPGTFHLRETTIETRLPTSPTHYVIHLQTGKRIVRSFGNVGAILSGSVFLDQNKDGAIGVKDPGDVGIGSAHLFLDNNNDGAWDASEPVVRTRPNGRFVFSDVPAGVVRIRVFPIEGMRFTAGDVRKVNVSAGAVLARYFGVLPSS